MMEEIVILNIDDILADMPERIHYLQKKLKTWKAFSENGPRSGDQI